MVRNPFPSTRKGFTLIELLVVVAIIAILIALLLPAVQRAREAARRTQCRNNLKQIALAVNNYENKFNIFPPCVIDDQGPSAYNAAGCPDSWTRSGGFGWRMLILPDIEQQNLYNKIDFNNQIHSDVLFAGGCTPSTAPYSTAWTDNRNAIEVQLEAYLCPSDDTLSDVVADGAEFGSNYAAMVSTQVNYNYVTTNGAVTAKTDPTGLKQLGLMHWEKPARQRDVANDGTSHTIMIAEVDRGVSVRRQGGGLFNRCGRWYSVYACLTDSNRTPDDFGNNSNPIEDLVNSPDRFVRLEVYTDSDATQTGQAASSAHGGGAHVALVDGSIQWVTKGVDLTLYKATCTRAGGEDQTIEF